jgi:type I restriction enzyme S subunit
MTEQAAGLIGAPAFIPDDGMTYLHNQRLGKVEFYSDRIDAGFVYWFFNTVFFRKKLAETCTGMKVRHTSPNKVLRVPFPICPLAEQRRIVAKVTQLMQAVDRLENQRTAMRGITIAFAKAAVAAITSTEFTENERMKPPITEVVTVLKVGKKPKGPDAAPLATLLSEQKAETSAKTLWQLSGLEIDAFYRQLKTEMANGWIDEDKDKRAVQEVEDR